MCVCASRGGRSLFPLTRPLGLCSFLSTWKSSIHPSTHPPRVCLSVCALRGGGSLFFHPCHVPTHPPTRVLLCYVMQTTHPPTHPPTYPPIPRQSVVLLSTHLSFPHNRFDENQQHRQVSSLTRMLDAYVKGKEQQKGRQSMLQVRSLLPSLLLGDCVLGAAAAATCPSRKAPWRRPPPAPSPFFWVGAAAAAHSHSPQKAGSLKTSTSCPSTHPPTHVQEGE